MVSDEGVLSTPAPRRQLYTRSFSMPGATEENTSPISAVLRVLALSDAPLHEGVITSGSNVGLEICSEAGHNAAAMLMPLDEWMCQPFEVQGLSILQRSLLVTSPGLVNIKDDEDEDNSTMNGSSIKDLLGGIGRDNLPGHNTEDLEAFNIYNISSQTSRASDKLKAVSASATLSGDPGPSVEHYKILRCFVHDRVIRDLKSKSEPISFIRDIVREKIVGGALIREKQQYQKLVAKDVYELRVDEKTRVLFSRSKNAVLIIEIVWNHKLDKPIRRAQQEMSVMQNWMTVSGYPDEEPFVMIDWVSGRLRPLYVLNISYNAESGENEMGAGDGDSMFNPTMLDLVLSPQQKEACEHAMATTHESKVWEKDVETGTSPLGTLSRPTINIVVLQGSAGNGKTTCLLRSGLSRAKTEEKVSFIAATQIFADSVEQDLKGNISKDFRIIVKDKFTEMIRSVFSLDLLGTESGVTETSLKDVVGWLDDIESRKGKKLDEGAKRALCEWLMKGHREAADTQNYTEYVKLYITWKNVNKKRDEGDMWNDVILKLTAENEDDEGISVRKFDENSCHSRIKEYDRECDMLVIDEAQLYPAETYFKALMLWYRPRKALLLGMDTKQAVYLGCSNRKALIGAIHTAGWHQRSVISCSLKTNFRLPARLVALSNAMVCILKHFFGKVFDEYQMDEGYEGRSASGSDTLTATEATDAPLRSIERFPAMLVIGAAAVKLRKEICDRMSVDRRSVLSMRFADISSESAPANYDADAGRRLGGCTLADLPTIKFQAVSGLEISLPVIVDSLLTTYIEKLCPRRVFAALKGGRTKEVTGHEKSMMRTALCTVYTVLTRCRGPLIWLEDDLNTDLNKSHPLVRMLKEALGNNSMAIDFIIDPNMIDKKFLDRIFSLTDPDEVNAAYEESTCQILKKFKTSFFACSTKLASLLRTPHRGQFARDIPAELQRTDEYAVLTEDKALLLSQLAVSTHIGAEECRQFIKVFPDTLLLKAGSGDGSWAMDWGQDHKDIMRAVKFFPKTSRLVLRETTAAITAAPTSFVDSTGRAEHRSMERQLARYALRICTCGEELQPQDLKFVLAFTGQVVRTRGFAPAIVASKSIVAATAATAPSSSEIVWVVHQVADGTKRSWKCITEQSYLLSCFSKQAAGLNRPREKCRRMSTMLFKFEEAAELTITRADDGWMTLQERTFIAAGGVLAHSTSINAGMKCRCRARGVSLSGSAKNHSYGPFVVEIKEHIMGCAVKNSRVKAALSADVIRMPPVGDKRMIRLLDALFSGSEVNFDTLVDELSLATTSPSSPVSTHRATAAFVWNNLLGGKILFAGVEARLQPWALLLPSLTANMTGPQRDREVAALVLLDQMRRTVEACLQKERGCYTAEGCPSMISRETVKELDWSANTDISLRHPAVLPLI